MTRDQLQSERGRELYFNHKRGRDVKIMAIQFLNRLAHAVFSSAAAKDGSLQKVLSPHDFLQYFRLFEWRDQHFDREMAAAADNCVRRVIGDKRAKLEWQAYTGQAGVAGIKSIDADTWAA